MIATNYGVRQLRKESLTSVAGANLVAATILDWPSLEVGNRHDQIEPF